MRMSCMLIVALTSLYVLASSAEEQPWHHEVARLIQGKLIVNGLTIYRAAKVESLDGSDLSFRIEADPLFRVEARPIESDSTRGITLYELLLSDDGSCVLPERAERIEGTEFQVNKGLLFMHFSEALKDDYSGMPFVRSRPKSQISKEDLKKILSCADKVDSIFARNPFQSIRVYSDEFLVTEVTRAKSIRHAYEDEPGEPRPVTRIAIIPHQSSIDDFSVDVTAVSIMNCSTGDENLVLGNWKRGVSKAVAMPRDGDSFFLPPNVLETLRPIFPHYTKKSLQRAIAEQRRADGMGSGNKYEYCAPYQTGFKYSIRHKKKVVQEIDIYFSSGC